MEYTAKDRTPYTYLIGWSKLNVWYYGVRYAKNCNPSDLWIKYKTSSKHLKEFYKKYGEPDIKEIRKIFNTKESACTWELKVLQRMNVVKDNKWLNKQDKSQPPIMTGSNHPLYGIGHTDITKLKMRKPKSEEHKQNLSKPKSEEHKQNLRKPKSTTEKMKIARKKVCENPTNKMLEERIKHSKRMQGSNNPNYRKINTDEFKLKMSEKIKSLPKITCIFCNREFDKRNYKKWHGDKCKFKQL